MVGLDVDEECARRLQHEFDVEVAEKAARERFYCPLCLETASLQHSVELDCLHRLCLTCFFQYVEIKIREKRVTEQELCCPMPGCDCEVTAPQVEGATKGTPLWDRFLAARAELWRPQALEDQLCKCPSPSCGSRFLASAQLKQVRCPQCRTKFCPTCGMLHTGISCEAHRAWLLTNNAAEREFEQLARQQRWQRCPCCGAACERSHGCNFMTCNSEVCRGKNSFCYLCGQQLTTLQHFTHFPKGLFENACENVDRRGEEGLPEATFFEPGRANWLAGFVGGFADLVWGREEPDQHQGKARSPSTAEPGQHQNKVKVRSSGRAEPARHKSKSNVRSSGGEEPGRRHSKGEVHSLMDVQSW